VPTGHWRDINNHRAFFDDLAKKLNITEMDDWHMVTQKTVTEHGGGRLLSTYYGDSLVKGIT
jgi:hypothetical protein